MRVLLATPPQPTHSILPNKIKPFHKVMSWIGGKKPILGIQPPYGLLHLSPYLKKMGHSVFVFDGLISSKEFLMKTIKKEKIELVGISSVTWNWNAAKQLASFLKNDFPDIKLAIGGAHANGVRSSVLKECIYFDYAFYGDGEETFPKLVNSLSCNKEPEPMNGFAYRKNGEIIAAQESAIVKDINNVLFPDRESLGFDNYRPSPLFYRKLPFTAVFGARGCPYRCTFCHTVNRVRLRDPENIIEEIVMLQEKHGIREITFYDDTFTLNKKRVFRLCELILEKNINISWSASVRVDTISSEMLTVMKKAGCWRLLLGIESGSQRLLDKVKKGITLEQIENAVNMIYRHGIDQTGMFMFGIPTETYEDGLETIKFIKKLKITYLNVCSLTPLPGTKIYDEVVNDTGLMGTDSMSILDISYVPNTMTKEQLEDLLQRSFREFYFRISYFLRLILNIRSFSDVLRYLRGFVVVLLR